MLSDPLVIPVLEQRLAVTSNVLFAALANIYSFPGQILPMRVTADGDGSSTRRATMADGTKVALNIGHSTSKENAPFVTDRTVIRLDKTRVNLTTGKPVTASAYAVITLPQGNTFTADDAVLTMESLALFTILGGLVGDGNNPPYTDGTDGMTLIRLIQDGEA